MSVYEAIRSRRSQSKVTDEAPSPTELARLVEATASVADHSGLRPWRLIALRGDARVRLGNALAAASGLEGSHAQKLAEKPLRAPLLIAIVSSPKPSFKVPEWEQEAVASGVAHLLSLLLDDAGWGVMWRTGGHTRSAQVAITHGLAENEKLLGWLYVGGLPDKARAKLDRGKPRNIFAAEVLTELS